MLAHINEDKKKTEGQRVLFDIFNDIDNCPVSALFFFSLVTLTNVKKSIVSLQVGNYVIENLL